MHLVQSRRSIIVTGDDFGASSAVNGAIIEANRNGILTSASLMVTGEAFSEAVELARRNPRLAVGLHLVLIDGKAALPAREIPQIVDRQGRFSSNPFAAGFRYQCHPAARRQVYREIRAQLEKFRRTGLQLSHVDGHQHMHMPPVVLEALISLSREFGIRAVRVPSEEFGMALRLDPMDFLEKGKLAFFFGALGRSSRRRLESVGIRSPDRVYGLFQSGRVTEEYLLKLIPRIRASRVELYSHPTMDAGAPPGRGASRLQLEALMSGRVRELLERQGFRLATYFEMN